MNEGESTRRRESKPEWLASFFLCDLKWLLASIGLAYRFGSALEI